MEMFTCFFKAATEMAATDQIHIYLWTLNLKSEFIQILQSHSP